MGSKKIKTHTFPNGFRLIYEKSPSDVPISYLRTFCDMGSVYEQDGTRGSSHFIEHMIYKGTRLRPDRKKIFILFDQIGAVSNAVTTKRYTYFKIDCQDQHIQYCLTIISDMMLHSTFNKVEYEKELLVVNEENIKDINDTVTTIYDKMDEMVYEGSSYEYPVDIPSYHKVGLDYDKVLDVYHRFYHPDRMFLSIVTNISFEKVVALLHDTFFVKIKTVSNPETIISHNLTQQQEIRYELIKTPGEKALYIGIGFRTCDYYSYDKYVLSFLSYLLSGPMSSRMFMLLREENGLTYTSSASIDNNEVSGMLFLTTETDPKKLIKNGKGKGVLPLLISLINDLIKNGVTENEVNTTKGYLKGTMLSDLGDGGFIAEENGEEMIFKKNKENTIISYQELYNTILCKITKKQIDAAIKKYCCKSNLSICMVCENLPSRKSVEKECEKLIQ
jgi:predicted Zn-dependent peptidase